ncbi:MAG: hypothetical protein V4614_01440 [Pseudomonadota bacterium]
MALLGNAAVAMWWDILPAQREEFQEWHSREHFPERMGIEGFLRGSRWTNIDGGTGFFVMYELASYETLTSPGYLQSLNNPTPWSVKMMPHHLHMVRSQCKLLGSFGTGLGRAVLTIRLSPADGQAEPLLAGLEKLLARQAASRGIVGAHLLQTRTPDAAMTHEQKIRGGDSVADWIVLLSAYDTQVLQDALAKELSPQSLKAAGALEIMTHDIYALSYSLGKHDLEPAAQD